MQVETSREAVENDAARLEAMAGYGVYPGGPTCLEMAGRLRALLSERDAAAARAEAAERERDALRDEWEEIAAGITTEQPEVGALWPMVSEISGSLAAVRNLFKNEIAAHNRTKAQRDAATAERDALHTVGRRLLGMAASREYSASIGRHLAEHLTWPDDAPDAVHPTLEEARAALTSAKEPS